ncbi:MAG: ATP-dependent helicase/nuclease subunit [Acidobacteriota bacterium]
MASRKGSPPSIRLVESAAAELRLAEARAFIRARVTGRSMWLVGASRSSVDDLARSVMRECGATIGLHRFSVTQLAARLAAAVLADARLAPATYLGSEAVAARAVFEAQRDGSLDYFGPVAATPGFPRALARTLQELRLAHVAPADLGGLPLGGADLSMLLEAFEQQFAEASAIDRATLFDAATGVLRSGGAGAAVPLLLLDVGFESAVEFEFLQALIHASPDVLITVPFGDVQTLHRLESIGITAHVLDPSVTSLGAAGQAPDLIALRRNLFARRQPPAREQAGDVRFFSAPGAVRECVEVARRILEEARAGVAFDEMAVFVRSPQRYAGLLEHAFKRAGIPAWFDRGTVRPHPAGRAFMAVLACACEKLSARRFAEYLSVAQVPQATASSVPEFIAPDDELLGPVAGRSEGAEDEPQAPGSEGQAPVADDEPVVEGALRAPWKWETLIVESAVIGGDPGRWHRRLAGLAQEYRVRIQEETREDPESPRAKRLQRDLENLAHLRAFALPIIDHLAAWPSHATWGEWLGHFSDLAPMVLRQPERVLRVLAELRPMAAIGPVSLDEARDVLGERVLTLELDPPRNRYGRVFVGGPQQARGRAFRVVFVAGLAERMFPLKPHEDPMLLDEEMRVPLAAGLAVQEDRGRNERLMLRLAVGAATERLWLSYPRIDVAESRPRVPSFYALDIMRAITGRVPDHEELQERAAAAGAAGLAWPSPSEPARAIDDFEHDLSVLRELLLTEDVKTVRGHAHYLLRLNDALKRSVSARWSRARSSWTPFDGITRITGTTRDLLAAQRLGSRPYSLSALQKFSSCPYQFLLSAVYRLQPAEDPEPLQKLDPLTRGALFHAVQAAFFRELRETGRLPVTEIGIPRALSVLDATVARIAAEYYERLAPAIDRVWRDEVADIARDLRVWVRRLPEGGDWQPEYFEYSFGLSDDGRDPRSAPDPVLIDGRFLLRGSVDLIEQKPGGVLLRVTDHKTGKNRTTPRTVVGGGAALQPVLYSLVVEKALATPVASGRLFYCTAAGGFTSHEIPINAQTRHAGLEALEIVDRAIELGFLPAAPADRACVWCDFRTVCGPNEEKRIRVKSPDKLGDLQALRNMP